MDSQETKNEKEEEHFQGKQLRLRKGAVGKNPFGRGGGGLGHWPFKATRVTLERQRVYSGRPETKPALEFGGSDKFWGKSVGRASAYLGCRD